MADVERYMRVVSGTTGAVEAVLRSMGKLDILYNSLICSKFSKCSYILGTEGVDLMVLRS